MKTPFTQLILSSVEYVWVEYHVAESTLSLRNVRTWWLYVQLVLNFPVTLSLRSVRTWWLYVQLVLNFPVTLSLRSVRTWWLYGLFWIIQLHYHCGMYVPGDCTVCSELSSYIITAECTYLVTVRFVLNCPVTSGGLGQCHALPLLLHDYCMIVFQARQWTDKL
jgi:hypothetical protein